MLEAFLASAHRQLYDNRASRDEEGDDFSEMVNTMLQSHCERKNITMTSDEISTSKEFASTMLGIQKLFNRYVKKEGEKHQGNSSARRDISFDVEFEHILKYVHLPICPPLSLRTIPPARVVFDWLSECKFVERILEVRVDDDHSNAHSEEDIAAALKRFNILHLDWRRADISIHTILDAAPRVEELHLYSSGSLATIDHWTGPQGLRRLRHVNIHKFFLRMDRLILQ